MQGSSRNRTLHPRRKPVQTRSRQTVDAILRAAAQVFAVEGYAGGTTNHIAERAGVSIGSLYEYFPNKDALLAALIEDHVEAGAAILEQAAAQTLYSGRELTVPQVVRRFVEAMVDLHARDRALHRVLFEQAPLPRRVRRRIAELENQAAAHIEAWLRARPDRTQRDPARAAAIIVQTVEGLTHRLVLYGERDTDVEAWKEEIVALVCAYL